MLLHVLVVYSLLLLNSIPWDECTSLLNYLNIEGHLFSQFLAIITITIHVQVFVWTQIPTPLGKY